MGNWNWAGVGPAVGRGMSSSVTEANLWGTGEPQMQKPQTSTPTAAPAKALFPLVKQPDIPQSLKKRRIY